jgi:hypothetical protein
MLHELEIKHVFSGLHMWKLSLKAGPFIREHN